MSLRSQIAMATFSVLATIALAATAADARPGQGRGHRPQPSQPVVQEVVPQAESPLTVETTEVTAVSTDVTVETSSEFESGSETVDQDSLPLYGTTAQGSAENPQNLPPGLQRRIDNGRGLPPGLQRQIDSGRGLPAGLNR